LDEDIFKETLVFTSS